jgi:hypothetical protein
MGLEHAGSIPSRTTDGKPGRGPVCPVIFPNEASEAIDRLTVSDEPDMTLDGTASRNELSNWSSQIAPIGALSTSGNKNMRVVISGKEAGNSYAFCQELHDGRGGGIALDGLGTVRLKRQRAPLLQSPAIAHDNWLPGR